jgi:hypothetical protein
MSAATLVWIAAAMAIAMIVIVERSRWRRRINQWRRAIDPRRDGPDRLGRAAH